MSKLEGAECTAAFLHDNAFYPGLGEIKKELSLGNNGINRVTKITIDGLFVVVKILSSQTKREYTLPIPTTNFKFLVLNERVVTTPPLVE